MKAAKHLRTRAQTAMLVLMGALAVRSEVYIDTQMCDCQEPGPDKLNRAESELLPQLAFDHQTSSSSKDQGQEQEQESVYFNQPHCNEGFTQSHAQFTVASLAGSGTKRRPDRCATETLCERGMLDSPFAPFEGGGTPFSAEDRAELARLRATVARLESQTSKVTKWVTLEKQRGQVAGEMTSVGVCLLISWLLVARLLFPSWAQRARASFGTCCGGVGTLLQRTYAALLSTPSSLSLSSSSSSTSQCSSTAARRKAWLADGASRMDRMEMGSRNTTVLDGMHTDTHTDSDTHTDTDLGPDMDMGSEEDIGLGLGMRLGLTLGLNLGLGPGHKPDAEGDGDSDSDGHRTQWARHRARPRHRRQGSAPLSGSVLGDIGDLLGGIGGPLSVSLSALPVFLPSPRSQGLGSNFGSYSRLSELHPV